MGSIAETAKRGIIYGFDEIGIFTNNYKSSFKREQIAPAIDLFVEEGLMERRSNMDYTEEQLSNMINLTEKEIKKSLE